MATSTITTNDNWSVELEGATFRDEFLLFADADVYAKGTILARKSVSDTITVAYTRDAASDYTAVASQAAGATLQTGAYTVTAGTLSAGVGTWTVVSPNGLVDTVTSSAADDALVFPILGLTLTVTAVAAAFTTGDVITVTPAAQTGLPMVPFSPTGTGGEQAPLAILTYPVTATAAGSLAARVAIGGKFNATRLVIDEDGDATNVTKGILDSLAGQGLVCVPVEQLSTLDNGAS